MPYFTPTPDVDQWFYWIRPGGQLPIISRWPKAGSNRTDCRFQLPISKGTLWTASRWWVEILLGGASPNYLSRGFLDLEALGINHLYGSAGVDADGWEVSIDIQGYETTPVVGPPGVVAILRADNVSITANMEWTLWYFNQDLTHWKEQITLNQENASFGQLAVSGLPFGTITGLLGGSLPDCFNFVSIGAPEAGFCACNGTDSWIKFTTWFPNGTTRFLWEYDIRPTAPVSNIAIRGDSTNGAFFMGHATFDNAVWWNRSVSLSPGLVVGVWQSVRMEHDWTIPGDFYTVWIDGVQQGQNAGTFTSSWFDEIGKVGANFRGVFDVRNLKHTTGTPAAPNIILDIPLDIDACPVVGLPIKGTTFNMDLPSCP